MTAETGASDCCGVKGGILVLPTSGRSGEIAQTLNSGEI